MNFSSHLHSLGGCEAQGSKLACTVQSRVHGAEQGDVAGSAFQSLKRVLLYPWIILEIHLSKAVRRLAKTGWYSRFCSLVS